MVPKAHLFQKSIKNNICSIKFRVILFHGAELSIGVPYLSLPTTIILTCYSKLPLIEESFRQIVIAGEKNDKFSFSVKLISKLVCLTNIIIFYNLFFF